MGLRRQLLVLLAAAAVVVALGAAAAWPKGPSAPTSLDQPLHDGCQRSLFGVGLNTSPEWVHVNHSPAIEMARGVVRVSHASLEDAILPHASFDYNGNLVPDRQFRFLVGGSPAQHTENFAGAGEETGRLHFEWESAALPFFAWPTDGDRATLWGSWIWDCGHWIEGGAVTGERTELHPLNAIVVNRRHPYLPARNESETDAFISNQGTAAQAVEQCALTHKPASPTAYDSGFNACAMALANQLQPLERSYSFFVPAPPRPPGASRLKLLQTSVVRSGSAQERVRAERNGFQVTVSPKAGHGAFRYGKRFFALWAGGTAKPPATLKVTLESIVVNQADPDPIYNAPTSPWTLYLDLNGDWLLLNDLVPQLSAVSNGQTIPINHTFTIHVPSGAGVWLQLAGRECDEPAGITLLGHFANQLRPCPASQTEVNPNIVLVFVNDDVGTILDTFASAGAALGSHRSTAVATTNRFPGSGPISFGDGKQGNGGYVLTYAIRRG